MRNKRLIASRSTDLFGLCCAELPLVEYGCLRVILFSADDINVGLPAAFHGHPTVRCASHQVGLSPRIASVKTHSQVRYHYVTRDRYEFCRPL